MKYKVKYTKTIDVISDKKLSIYEIEAQARNQMCGLGFTQATLSRLTPQVTARLRDYQSKDLTENWRDWE